MNHTKTLVLLTFFLSLFVSVDAQTSSKEPPPVRLLLKAALELGGDEVAEIYFTNGETQSVEAGQGGSIAAGTQIQIPGAEKLLLHATVGFKYVTTQADNAHIRLTRVPLQFTANYMVARKLRIGAGLASHRAIRFKADGIGPDINFNPATGPTFEVAYSGIGLTYTAMTYQDKFNNRYSANAIGLSFALVVPNR